MSVPDPVVEADMATILTRGAGLWGTLRGRTVLLTGGSGFVGSYLVESVAALNATYPESPCQLLLPTRSLTAVRDRWPHLIGIPHLHWFTWRDAPLEPPFARCDYVIHGASPADPAAYLRDPAATLREIVSMTDAVLAYARSSGAERLLYLSSGAVYGSQPAEMEAIPEDYAGGVSLTDPRSCYAEAKRYCELQCQLSGLPVVVARLFAFLGPYQDLHASFAVPQFLRQAIGLGRIQVQGDGLALRTFCYASDLTLSLWTLLLRGEAGTVYNVGASSPVVSIRALAEEIASVVGNVTVEVLGRADANNPVRNRYIPDIRRLATLYQPTVTLREALEKVLCSTRFRRLLSSSYFGGNHLMMSGRAGA